MAGTTKTGKHEKQTSRGGGFFAGLCSLLGTLLILAVILVLLPVTVPRLLGFEIYNVISGSMSPAIPQGSMVLVKPMDWSSIQPGDVIAFEREGTVVAHRVKTVQTEERSFITKGDANAQEDFIPVPFEELIGRVERHVPVLGAVEMQFSTLQGKLSLAALVVSGLLFRWLAGRIRAVRAGR